MTIADWPLRLPADLADAEVERLRLQADELAAAAQYGWGHTIDFGPFTKAGLLGQKYLRIAGTLDEWGWWPALLAGRRVADVGAFTGGLSMLMAARGAASVTAVDEVPEHLAQCTFVAKAFGMAAVHPLQASLYDLRRHLEPGSLDLVLMAGVLYHASDMLVGLLAMQELLRPGGDLLVETNAVECYEHSYANYGRYFGGMWWQPTALCLADMAEHAGFERPEVRFYQPGRALARLVKPEQASPPFRRGLNWRVDDLRDDAERGLDPSAMAPAPCHHPDAGMLARAGLRAADRALRLPMSLRYPGRRWSRSRRR